MHLKKDESTGDRIVKDLSMYSKAKVISKKKEKRKSKLLHIHIAQNIFKAKSLIWSQVRLS